MLAPNYGKDKILEMLVKAGVDVNIKDKYGRTALDYGSCKIKLK